MRDKYYYFFFFTLLIIGILMGAFANELYNGQNAITTTEQKTQDQFEQIRGLTVKYNTCMGELEKLNDVYLG